jgi:predicted hydrocarbon binding protein
MKLLRWTSRRRDCVKSDPRACLIVLFDGGAVSVAVRGHAITIRACFWPRRRCTYGTAEAAGLYSARFEQLSARAEGGGSMTPDQSVTVKGSPVRSLQKFLDGVLTVSQRQEVLAALPGDYGKRFSTPVLATETVPVHILNRMTEEAARVLNEPVEAFARRAGREAAGEAVKGVYRFFALVLTPTALLSKASSMWSSLYNRGQLQVSKQTANTATIRLADFPSELAGCSRVTGWIERMAELTGAKDVSSRQTECVARGGEVCQWELKWS